MSKIQEEIPLPIDSVKVLNRVNALLKIQEEHEDLTEAMHKEITEIEKKYAVKFEPLYTKRSTIVNGAYEPTEEETKTTEPIVLEGLKDTDVKGIPNFWYTVFTNHSQFKDLVVETDKEALSYLLDIKFNVENEKELKCDFLFGENPFFSNQIITKTVSFDDQEDSIESITTTPIEWKEGKNFTVKKTSKKVKVKGKGKKPTFTTQVVDEAVPGFFADFVNPIIPEPEDDQEDDNAAAQYDFLQYQCLVTLKDVLVPSAIVWYLGKGVEEDDNEYGDGNFDFDEEDYDEDSEDDEPHQPRQGVNKSAPQAPTGQDCKQQ